MQSKLHVAIIMDGNGRWALQRGKRRSAGHRAGLEALRTIIEAAPDLAISTLSVFAFSSDNWKRPAPEVSALMNLMRGYLMRETKRFVESGVQLVVFGRLDRLPRKLQSAIAEVESATERGKRLRIRIAIDYSSRDAIFRGISLAAGSTLNSRDDLSRFIVAPASGAMSKASPEDAEIDLLIRTGAEKRLSDFMLWESAYAELIFCEEMWPDFGPAHLRMAIAEFHKRTRRFGGLCLPQFGQSIDQERDT